jgi:uncharacterized membrane protein
MRPRTPTTWYRKAAVAGSIAVLVLIAGVLFLTFRPDAGKHSAEARLLSEASATAGVSGGLTADAAVGGGLRLCNKTASRVGVAIGYKENQSWTTEGWWNIASGTCDTLRPGALVSRFYYVYAIDYDEGGVWGGKAAMCTSDRKFTINGIEDCVARGFERRGFFEVDTGEQRSWTVQLTEPGQQGTGG